MFCDSVKWTAEDAVSLGYEVFLITDATKGLYLDPTKSKRVQEIELIDYLRSLGVKTITSEEFVDRDCPVSETTVLEVGTSAASGTIAPFDSLICLVAAVLATMAASMQRSD